MTFAEWVAQSGENVAVPAEPHAVPVQVDFHNPARRLLWELSDYAVSAVCGLTVWIVPRV